MLTYENIKTMLLVGIKEKDLIDKTCSLLNDCKNLGISPSASVLYVINKTCEDINNKVKYLYYNNNE